VPRKKHKRGVWDDLDRRLSATDKLARDFFSDVQAITVEDTPFSQLELSDEVREEPTVAVRFDSDGMAYEEQIDGERAQETEPLEPMPLSRNVGATEWSSAFAEIHARAFDLANYSKVTATRYIQSGSGKKISCLPSTVDFLADVQIVARKVLSPALYRVWDDVYWQGYGKDADRVPQSVQMAIQMRCGTAWKKAGLLPWHKYWQIRTPADKLRAVNLQIVPDARAARNKRRRARRAARPAISVYEAAA